MSLTTALCLLTWILTWLLALWLIMRVCPCKARIQCTCTSSAPSTSDALGDVPLLPPTVRK